MIMTKNQFYICANTLTSICAVLAFLGDAYFCGFLCIYWLYASADDIDWPEPKNDDK